MGLTFENKHTLRYPWSTVVSAFWRKYPNSSAPNLKEIDCVDRKIDRSGRLVTSRLSTWNFPVPSLFSKLFPAELYSTELAVVDPRQRTLTIRSRNMTLSSIFVLHETCTYKIHPENKSWTQYHQEATITATTSFGSMFEKYTLDNMKKASMNGVSVIESLCERIHREGAATLVADLTQLQRRLTEKLESTKASLGL